jgi:hypothetical protein
MSQKTLLIGHREQFLEDAVNMFALAGILLASG